MGAEIEMDVRGDSLLGQLVQYHTYALQYSAARSAM